MKHLSKSEIDKITNMPVDYGNNSKAKFAIVATDPGGHPSKDECKRIKEAGSNHQKRDRPTQ